MKVSAEAKKLLSEFLEDNEEGFIRVGRVTVGGGCCAKILLGVSVDEDFNEEDDLKFEVDGLPVVIEKSLNEQLKDISIEVDPDSGIVVKHA